MMQAYMTSEVDPCDDFYQFACGNWAKLNPMPTNNNLYSIFEILSTSTANYIKDLLEQPTSHNEPLAFTKAKNYYKSCLNYETIQSRGSKPLLSHLSSLGTWPMINNSSNYDWIWLAAQLSKYHTDILITYFVSQDKVIPSRYVINLDQTSLGVIDREDFLNRSNTKYFAYKEYMLKVAKLLGGDENVTEAVEDILTFETHLANISYPGNANPDPSDVKKFTIAKINEYIPDIDLKRYISLTFNFSGNSTEHVVVHSVKYFEKLGELLGKTEAKTIANYLLWKHINIWMTVLDFRFMQAQFQYVNALYGTIEFPERSKFCIRQTTNNMGLAIGAMFVQKYFDKSNKNDTIVMARNIRSGFREVLFNNCWINNKTKHLAEEKINAILFSIGYSDDVLIEQKLDDYFKDVNIDPVLFFENNKNIFMATALRAKIGLPQNNLDWYISPSESGSYYDMRKNNIKISAAILQPPFYHKYFPKSLNYGGIGVQMGHLMSHSFDQLGIKYDQMAKLNEDWQKAFEQFSQKAACLIEQYDNLISGESNIQSEDLLFFHNDYIAEDGGIKQAFVAYKKWLNIHGDYDETLPEMNYTSGQLFFLNYAQVSCSSDRLQPLRKARVIGTLRNNEEFSKEFNCPPGSPMNPKKKCFFCCFHLTLHNCCFYGIIFEITYFLCSRFDAFFSGTMRCSELKQLKNLLLPRAQQCVQCGCLIFCSYPKSNFKQMKALSLATLGIVLLLGDLCRTGANCADDELSEYRVKKPEDLEPYDDPRWKLFTNFETDCFPPSSPYYQVIREKRNVPNDFVPSETTNVFQNERILNQETTNRELNRHSLGKERESIEASNQSKILLNYLTKLKYSEIVSKEEEDKEIVRHNQAKLMQMYMDTTVDPCEDFYQFACGRWPKLNPIPKDKGTYDTFEILRESLDNYLKNLLEQPISPNEPAAYTKAKNLYKSCINYEILEERGAQPLLDLIDSLGGWPLLNKDWKSSNFDWIWLTGQLRRYNNDLLIAQWVGPDIKNSNEYIIHIDQTTLGLPTRDYYLQPANAVYLEAYKNYFVKIATLLGADYNKVTQAAEEVIQFEIDLAKITIAPDERRNLSELYQRMTVGELRNFIPQVDWQRYLSIVFNRPCNSTEHVVVFAVRYIENLVALMGKTDTRTIANYLLWRFVRHRVNNLDDRFQEAKQKFYYILFGREESPPRWKNCVNQVNSNMGMAVGAMFVQKYFDESSKNDTMIMTRDIQQAFREILSKINWIDEETKHLAEEKIDAITLRIGYPDSVLVKEELDERFKDVDVDPGFYFENTLSILRHFVRMEQAQLGSPVNKSVWDTAPAQVNAYYSRNKNQMMFPAGILQPPFYHKYFPKCLNYGGIGVVIGHEMTHGFDDKGRLFDKTGNLKTWWREIAVTNFHERAQCIIEQYGKFMVEEAGLQVDGINTQGENIADNGGIKQAFWAYQKWLEKHGDSNEKLPGMNYTAGQLFFMNFAQIWCGATRPAASRNKLKTAVHSPGKFRVIGTLSNNEDFAKEFNCPLGSPMNPKKKCSVW
ncbi:uncharacterized protein LOC106668396 [Cimex lectularius]|uniref:Endothelin-converting enzyme n=1 Tax=Cimex lectularius TaxID=79782 RepID=A0A8I6SVN2_CIMLE|nr:uncharacterized protein LOC106668396 [Cimex lectularius]